jgi:hypothetical protein
LTTPFESGELGLAIKTFLEAPKSQQNISHNAPATQKVSREPFIEHLRSSEHNGSARPC